MLKVTTPEPPADAARSVRALIAATFVIASAFGLNMPLLPPLIAAVSKGAGTSVPLHSGLLAAVFTFALGAAAPAWGAWSDRVGRRPVLLIGMGGFAVTLLASSAPAGLAGLYVEQLFSGVAAAAVMPVASALVADLAPDDHWRASRLAWLNMALVAGFILGPIAGSAADRLLIMGALDGRVLVTPFIAIAAAATGVALMLWRVLPSRGRRCMAARMVARRSRLVTPLLGLTFVVSSTIGIFEVAIAIRGGRGLGLTPAQVGTLFTSCSLVMFAAQAVVFAPKAAPVRTARLLTPAFLALAAGLAGAGVAGSFGVYLAAVTVFAASGGVLVPVLAYWVSRHAGGAQGGQLGRQTAAAGLGQAVGSGLAGLLLDRPAPQGLALWVGAAVALAAAAASVRLAGRLGGPQV